MVRIRVSGFRVGYGGGEERGGGSARDPFLAVAGAAAGCGSAVGAAHAGSGGGGCDRIRPEWIQKREREKRKKIRDLREEFYDRGYLRKGKRAWERAARESAVGLGGEGEGEGAQGMLGGFSTVGYGYDFFQWTVAIWRYVGEWRMRGVGDWSRYQGAMFWRARNLVGF